LVVFVLGLFISTFFISFHADATEAIQIVFLMDEHFAAKGLGGIKKEFNDSIIRRMKLHKDFAAQISKIYYEIDDHRESQINDEQPN
jgi:hypothetical protein